MLTRKDYKAIAAMINGEVNGFKAYVDKRDCNAGNVIDRMVDKLTDYMVSDNPRFDHSKFVAACYGEK
jgi:hypothetical protein